MPELLEDLTARLARRDSGRSEATLQADIRAFILAAGLNVDANDLAEESVAVTMEAQLGDGSRRRIDVESGTTVIEVKKNLRIGTVLESAETQLGQYVNARCDQTGARYLGVLTDGREWILYVPDPDQPEKIRQAADPLVIGNATDTERLRSWLGAVLSTVEQIRPTPEEIEGRLGAESPAHHADHASLQALFDANRHNPTVVLKRELWGKLLKTAFGSSFEDVEHLFLDHTLLVLTAEAIAHAVIGFDLSGPNAVGPRELAEGGRFVSAQIHGVVEADFFDWVLEVDGGEQFVRSLAARIGKFRWDQVEHDVLKHLYESVITQQTREALGEYYTPDWLADRVLAKEYESPLDNKVLDASCGSGTFIFHAVRSYLEAAEAKGLPVGEAVDGVVRHVFGMDIHPVAVTLARVTYLLAIGAENLRHPSRGKITIPVYLGDSLQWEQQTNLLSTEDAITVETTGEDIMSAGGGLLFDDNLVFPLSILSDAQNFDSLVSAMADKVLSSADDELAPARMTPQVQGRMRAASPSSRVRQLVDPILTAHKVPEEDKDVLRTTFSTLRQLHLNGRDHIWGYYVRNLVRPLWLSMPENRVDVLVGNPPWLRYSKMSGAMQDRYKRLAKERNLLSGALGASARDLSTLFVTRAVELYLKPEGRFGFVMPHGTLTRKPHHGFRTGRWNTNSQTVSGLAASFEEAWEFVRIRTGFPMVSCVIFGRKVSSTLASAMPSVTKNWKGTFTNHAQTWAKVQDRVTILPGRVTQHDPNEPVPVSPYAKRFRQGALILPRMLVCVERVDAGPLGAGAGRVKLTSRRSTQDKEPWKFLDSLGATVAESYVFPLLLGETVLPYRMHKPLECVVPIRDRQILSGPAIKATPDLDSWWSLAEAGWVANRSKTDKTPLHERIDYHGQLSAQLASESPYRVCYTSSGSRLAAAITTDQRAIVEHKLYWAPARTMSEARYLEAILNSPVLLERVKPLQNLGLFGERDFDKYVFLVPFPAWDGGNDDHAAIASLAQRAETVASTVDVTSAKTFQQARKLIDLALAADGVAADLAKAIEKVIPQVDAEAAE